MKAIPAILSMIMAVLAGAGCGKGGNSGQQTNAASSGNPITAPVDYLGAVANAQQKAIKTIDVTSLNQAIQMFNVSEGRYPKDLNELVAQQYLREIPKAPYGQKIVYDATNGVVKVVAAQ